jgi:outer membrane murein-binding lipoprotein Lpp
VIRPIVAVLACAALALAGCESTQSKSAKLAAKAGDLEEQVGLSIKRVSKDVKVTRRVLLRDANGAAVVIGLRNVSKRTQVRVPVLIDVRAKGGGKSLFSNSDAGLEESLTGASVLLPGQTLLWVNDQVIVAGKPGKVRAKVGVARGKAAPRLPKITLTEPTFETDPTSGTLAVGKARNASQIDQSNLTIFAVARRGKRIVAAGRGAIERLKAGDTATYQVFFIGNPKGARVTLAAPPTTFR